MDDNLPKAIKQLNLDPQTEKMFRRCLNLEYRFMFFYGTDTPEQLELKFGQKLTRLGAILPEHVLAFGGPDESWSARNDGRKGGPSIVDTRWCSGLTPAEAQRLPGVPGYVAFVSPQHFRMLWNLNALEYDIRSVQPVIRTPSGRTDPIPAQAFVRRQMDWSGGGPADACMCAVQSCVTACLAAARALFAPAIPQRLRIPSLVAAQVRHAAAHKAACISISWDTCHP